MSTKASELRSMLREIGRNVIEKTGVDVTVCGGPGDALYWRDVPGLVDDCVTLLTMENKRQEKQLLRQAKTIECLREVIFELRPSDTAEVCWCAAKSTNCFSRTCMHIRTVLGYNRHE